MSKPPEIQFDKTEDESWALFITISTINSIHVQPFYDFATKELATAAAKKIYEDIKNSVGGVAVVSTVVRCR